MLRSFNVRVEERRDGPWIARKVWRGLLWEGSFLRSETPRPGLDWNWRLGARGVFLIGHEQEKKGGFQASSLSLRKRLEERGAKVRDRLRVLPMREPLRKFYYSIGTPCRRIVNLALPYGSWKIV